MLYAPRVSYGEVGNDAAVNYYGYQALYYITKNGGNPALVRQKLSASRLEVGDKLRHLTLVLRVRSLIV